MIFVLLLLGRASDVSMYKEITSSVGRLFDTCKTKPNLFFIVIY